MTYLNSCQICGNSDLKPFLECEDFTVSRETYKINECNSCGFKFTNPRPEDNQLGKYYISEEYVSHSNTKKGIVNYVYQMVRQYTLLKKLKLISKYYKTGTLLDIGSGTGEFLNVMHNAKWKTTGIEPSDAARNMAISNYKLDIKPELELKNLTNESFDVITMWHVLEHVPNLNERVEELKRLLNPSGLLIIAVPNCNSFDAKIYKKHWAAYDVPRHLYHFCPKDIENLFKNHDLKLIKTLPMVFDSFYISLLSEKLKKGKVNYLKAFWNGLSSNFMAMKSGERYSSQIYLIRK